MKKAFIISALLILGLASHAFAADGFVPLAPIPGLTDSQTTGSVINSSTLATFFNSLYTYLIGIAAVLAVIEITWAGIRITSNQDNVGVITDSKGHIYNAIFGLILILAPALVFGIINPSILNLSTNLPPINTLSAPATSTPVDNSGVPDGATTYSFGSTTPAGQWCYSATLRSRSYGQNTSVCFADETGCSAALAQAKATANGTVDNRTVCQQH